MLAKPKRQRLPVSVAKAEQVGKGLGVDFKDFSPATMRKGMLVELEHGKKAGALNVTDDDLYATAKIALVHLREDFKYYAKLARMEKPAKAKAPK